MHETILLDTHVWVWWVFEPSKLSPSHAAHLNRHQAGGLGVSVYSVWEVAMLVAHGKLNLFRPVDDWVRDALAYPHVHLLPFTPEIAIESTRLPDPFHKDPADRILVATARMMNVPLLTEDRKILAYPHVTCLP